MDELRNALHAAAAEPPPTRIDLDELIDGTRRRSRLQYRIGAVAGAVALSTGALLVPMVLLPSGGLSTAGGGAPPSGCPSPSFSPVPVPTESLGVTAGPTYDPSVPAASHHPSSDPSEPAFPSGSPSQPAYPSDSPSWPDTSPTPAPSASWPRCGPAGPLYRCPFVWLAPSNPQPSRSPAAVALELAMCIRLAPLHAATGDAFPSGWELSQAMVIPAPPHGYKSRLVLTKGHSLIEVQLTVANERSGNVPGRCAALAHGRAGDCKVQREGDAVLVAGQVVYDVRPDGTTVTAEAGPPATTDELTTLARSAQLVSVMN